MVYSRNVSFGWKIVSFLENVVFGGGVSVDPRKVKEIVKCE